MSSTLVPEEFAPLLVLTPKAWTEVVLADFDAFLIDHACCERKAAALCVSYVARHADRPTLVEPMVALAREELEHFQQVYRILRRRGLTLGPNDKDAYAGGLIEHVRSGPAEGFLDRLVVAAFIEARSHERFHRLAEALPGAKSASERELAPFYRALARAEAGHFKVFTRAAASLFPEAEVDRRVVRFAEIEAELVERLPWRAAVH
jgi:tRNA-(ms[2]io[6]A)-hydroxylase